MGTPSLFITSHNQQVIASAPIHGCPSASPHSWEWRGRWIWQAHTITSTLCWLLKGITTAYSSKGQAKIAFSAVSEQQWC